MSKEIEHEMFITTNDNPFNPFTEFLNWYKFDCSKGYFTCSLIDRIEQRLETEASKADEVEDLHEQAIKEVLVMMPTLYKKVENETEIIYIPLDESLNENENE